MSLGLVIGDLRGKYSRGAADRYVSRSRGGAYPPRACPSAAYLSVAYPAGRAGTGVKRKMAGSEESDKYKKKIFQKVGLFMIRHYL